VVFNLLKFQHKYLGTVNGERGTGNGERGTGVNEKSRIHSWCDVRAPCRYATHQIKQLDAIKHYNSIKYNESE
jgi:hypothetical protein